LSKRNVKLAYKDMVAIKHALLASVSNRKEMAADLDGKTGAIRIPQLLKDIEHETRLAKLMQTEAKTLIGGANSGTE
jgi:hypothetical protein